MTRLHWVESASIVVESKPWDGRHAMTHADMQPARLTGTIVTTTSDPTKALQLAAGLNAGFAEWLDIELKISTNDDGDGFYTHTYEYPLEPTITVVLQNDAIPTPEPIDSPDFTELIKACKEYVEVMDSEDFHEDNDDTHYIFEAALEAVFGKDVWKWVNQVMK